MQNGGHKTMNKRNSSGGVKRDVCNEGVPENDKLKFCAPQEEDSGAGLISLEKKKKKRK